MGALDFLGEVALGVRPLGGGDFFLIERSEGEVRVKRERSKEAQLLPSRKFSSIGKNW